MAEIVRMPEVLAGASEAAVQSWLVSEGDEISVGQPIAEIETDKAIVELMAESAGTVSRLLVPAGESVSVGEAIIALRGADEDTGAIDAALAHAGGAAAPAAAEAEPTSAPLVDDPDTAGAEAPEASAPESAPAQPESRTTGEGRRIFATPLVRRLAHAEGVDIAGVEGTGPNGRIVRRDLEHHLEQRGTRAPGAEAPTVPTPSDPNPATPKAPASAPDDTLGYRDVPLDRMRRAIARRLTESKSSVPHFYLTADCRVDAMLALRAQVNEAAPRKTSLNDFVVKAVAMALVEVPEANAIWNGDSVRVFDGVSISVAVAIDGGLTTPTLRDVHRSSLTEVSASIADLAERGRAGRLKQHELEGGSFSVSNLGMYGTTEFSAILNPPQSGILAVGAARPMPVVTDGALQVATVMTVTLSADHRVLDGAVAAQWLAAFQRRIENPLSILI
ncbi:dihydrolipoamide acetyltransferase family protein [Microbacterium sp. HMH0099]|uniref:dihydrolipoamide acetyltransferase family protein n=1 Tax=Microbacterium sp. HMH0099 TaxID=3414026 RepID=UPI003BF63B09